MATLYTLTVSDILQIVSDKRGEDLNTDASRVRSCSRAEQDLALRKYWRLFLLIDQTLTGDGTTQSFTVGSVSYPMRDKGLSEVFVGGTTEDKRYRLIDHTEYKNAVARNSSDRVVFQWFDAVNDLWKMKINPIPANGDTIYYSYFWYPPVRSSSSSSIVTVNKQALAYLTLADIYESEEEPQLSLDSINKAEAIIGTMEGIEEAPAIGQIYTMGTQENAIRSRGIGSY